MFLTTKKPLDCKFWVDAITVKTDFVPLLIVWNWLFYTDLTGLLGKFQTRLYISSSPHYHSHMLKVGRLLTTFNIYVCIWSVSGGEAHQGSQGVTVGGLVWTQAYFPSTLVLAQNLQEQCVKAAEEKGWVSLHKHMFSTNERVPNRG